MNKVPTVPLRLKAGSVGVVRQPLGNVTDEESWKRPSVVFDPAAERTPRCPIVTVQIPPAWLPSPLLPQTPRTWSHYDGLVVDRYWMIEHWGLTGG